MTTVEDFLADTPTAPEAGAPTVRNGRYQCVHPETGKPTQFTRVTNWAKTLSDGYRLEQWKLRMTLFGAALRSDITARALAAGADNREVLQRLADEAKEVAGGTKGANLGTAMHDLTDRIDRGEDVELPPEMQADIAAYTKALGDHRVTIHRDLIERYVCHPELGVCGRFDRIVGWAVAGGDVVGDLKTGSYLDFLEIGIQLAIYAQAPWMWENGTGWVPKPVVDLERALVFHLPVGSATCHLYAVDIAAGWEAAQEAATVREWRRRRNLARQLEVKVDLVPDLEASLAAVAPAAQTCEAEGLPTGSATGPSPSASQTTEDGRNNPRFIAERVEWNRGRLQKVIELLDGAALPVARPAGLPAPGRPYPTWTEVELLEAWITELEKATTAPFPEGPPADPFVGFGPLPKVHPTPIVESPPNTPRDDYDALKARVDALPADLRVAVTVTARDDGITDVLHLSDGQVIQLAEIVARAEADHGTRKAYVASRLQDWGDADAETLRAEVAGERPLELFEADDVDRLDSLLDALEALTVVIRYADDGRLELHAGDVTLNGRFAEAKALAERHDRPKPRSTADISADPVLLALVLHARPKEAA